MPKTMHITCPSCGLNQKTTAARSEWCKCANNNLWHRFPEDATEDVARLKAEGFLSFAIVDEGEEGVWRVCGTRAECIAQRLAAEMGGDTAFDAGIDFAASVFARIAKYEES